MIDDFFYKLVRKNMPTSLYKYISGSKLGNKQEWEQVKTYKDIFNSYKIIGKNLSGSVVLEVGGGNQIFTALYFLNAGVNEVVLVDPKFGQTICKAQYFVEMEKSVDEFNATENLQIQASTFLEKIKIYDSIAAIDDRYNSLIDYAFSNFVLEHFDDLSAFFEGIAKLLSINGVSFNIVDLSDHTYHIFYKYRWLHWICKGRALFHLRYSDNVFKMINDKKCYMNRLLLPLYLELADKNGLVAEIVSKKLYRKVKIHDDVLAKFKDSCIENIFVTAFQVVLSKK